MKSRLLHLSLIILLIPTLVWAGQKVTGDLQVTGLVSCETIKTDGSGNVSCNSANSIDISSETNLSATTPIVLTGDNLSHANSGVTPSTYSYMTAVVDAKGHITSASTGVDPTSIAFEAETIRGVPFTDTLSALPLAINMTSGTTLDYDHFAGAIVTTSGIGGDVNFALPNPTIYNSTDYQEIYRVANTDAEGDYYVGIELAAEQTFLLHDLTYTGSGYRLKSKDRGATIVAYAIADKTYVVVPESGVWIEESF